MLRHARSDHRDERLERRLVALVAGREAAADVEVVDRAGPPHHLGAQRDRPRVGGGVDALRADMEGEADRARVARAPRAPARPPRRPGRRTCRSATASPRRPAPPAARTARDPRPRRWRPRSWPARPRGRARSGARHAGGRPRRSPPALLTGCMKWQAAVGSSAFTARTSPIEAVSNWRTPPCPQRAQHLGRVVALDGVEHVARETPPASAAPAPRSGCGRRQTTGSTGETAESSAAALLKVSDHTDLPTTPGKGELSDQKAAAARAAVHRRR